jgi:hypothetical protein
MVWKKMVIRISKRDYETVKRLVEDGNFEDLRPLLTKMDKSGEPKDDGFTFTDQEARVISNEELGDKVYYTVATPGEILKHNRYLKRAGIDAAKFRRACKAASKSWKPPIYFNYLLLNSNRLAAMPLFSDQPKDVFGA